MKLGERDSCGLKDADLFLPEFLGGRLPTWPVDERCDHAIFNILDGRVTGKLVRKCYENCNNLKKHGMCSTYTIP